MALFGVLRLRTLEMYLTPPTLSERRCYVNYSARIDLTRRAVWITGHADAISQSLLPRRAAKIAHEMAATWRPTKTKEDTAGNTLIPKPQTMKAATEHAR